MISRELFGQNGFMAASPGKLSVCFCDDRRYSGLLKSSISYDALTVIIAGSSIGTNLLWLFCFCFPNTFGVRAKGIYTAVACPSNVYHGNENVDSKAIKDIASLPLCHRTYDLLSCQVQLRLKPLGGCQTDTDTAHVKEAPRNLEHNGEFLWLV